MVKKGDTLIEVTIAVGIFSMVAIAMVAVMSNGVANAQTALESTLAREEIDIQAEALRYIQASYIANANETDKKFASLWREITRDAIVLNNDESNEITQYAPTSCEELYNPSAANNIVDQHGFILNPRKMGDFTEDTIGSVYFTARGNSDRFTAATINPRLVFGSENNGATENTLNSQYDMYDSLYRAEGIYVVPVRDANTTVIVNEDGSSRTSAFFDFYIRTCWYGSRSNDASIISTVIRLYDPDVVPTVESGSGD